MLSAKHREDLEDQHKKQIPRQTHALSQIKIPVEREREIQRALAEREREREGRRGGGCRTTRVWMNNHGNSSSSRSSGGINIVIYSVRTGGEGWLALTLALC